MTLAEAVGEPHIDLATVAQIRHLELLRPTVLSDLLTLFHRSATASIEAIRNGLDEGRWELLNGEMHALKGAAAGMGARRLSVLASLGELQAREASEVAGGGNLPLLKELADAIQCEFDLVYPQFRALADQA